LWNVSERQPAARHLRKAVLEGRLAHAYLIVGPRHVGKLDLALELACAVNCLAAPGERPCGECSQCRRISSRRHADIQVISLRRPQEEQQPRKEIGIDQVREVGRLASLMPFEGRYRVFIFDEAERMSEEASNALLKTLEEPPPNVLLVLTTTREEALLPTIRSRCQRLQMRPLPREEVMDYLVSSLGLEREEAERLARLSGGRLNWAVEAHQHPEPLERRAEELENLSGLALASLYERFQYADSLARRFSQDREAGREPLHLWLQWWRDILMTKEGVEGFVADCERLERLQREAERYSSATVVTFMHKLLETLDALEQNATPRLALENLMLALPR
jgi:DNA polymerase-3 subunit delta'